MSKKGNPLFQPSPSVEPEVLDDQVEDADRAGLIVMPLPGDVPLTRKEEKRLHELESIVTKNFRAFYDVGCALREIQQSRLYRQTHPTWEDYVKERWDMARRTAYKQIEAADVVDNVRNCVQIENVPHGAQIEVLPQNERQARTLTKYTPEKQIEIWAAAVESAQDGKITANHIRQTARRLYNEKVEQKVQKNKKAAAKAPKISTDFRTALQALYEQIDIERQSDWATTSRDEVARQLRGLLEAVEGEI